MIRKLMASSAILALMSAGAVTTALAQTDPANPPIVVENTAAATDLGTSKDVLTPDTPTLASVFIGRPVYSSTDPESDNIGNVNDLIVSEDGTITHAVVGVGGFLGIGQKNVAVPFDELEVVERDGDIRLVYAATREQLDASPEFDRTAYDPAARAAAENMAAQAPIGLSPPLAPLPGDDLTAPPVDQAMAPAEEMFPADDLATANAPALDAGTFVNASADQIRASKLIGMAVYGTENESIGEVSDLVLQKDGGTRVALVDVGGFLGVGEKTVGIPFDELHISKVEDGSERIIVAMSQDQLNQLPTFQVAPDDAAALTDPLAPAPDAFGNLAETPDAMMSPDGLAVTAEAPTASGEIVTGSIGSPAEYTFATQDISASALIGATVYGSDESSLGEVSDVVFDTSGEIEAVVIDVGGFLGIGEKPVAFEFGSLHVRKDAAGYLTVMVNATSEQLDAAPAYQDLNETAAAR